MKKVFALLLIVIMIITLGACKNSKNNDSASKVSSEVNNTTTSTDNTKKDTNNNSEVSSVTSNTSTSKGTSNKKKNNNNSSKVSSAVNNTSATNDTDYTELECRKVSANNWQIIKIQNSKTNMGLQFAVPNDWSIHTANSSTLNILRGKKVIGTITTKKLDPPKESYQSCSESNLSTETLMRIDLKPSGNKNFYYRFYEFVGTRKSESISLKMQIDYTELDEDAAYKIMKSVTCPPKYFPLPSLDSTNGSKEILIIGNSFINTSKIGSFLTDMLNTRNSEYYIDAVSIGMATVSTFANSSDICNDISQGRYCYVFMCGFYSSDAVRDFHTIKDACKKSNTKLVIFPAHNENRAAIDAAVSEHEEAYFLDWKAEVDALIDTGINYYDFCVNDSHKHSTPLAGYVGAHMIFRELFGTPVPTVTDSAPLDAEYLNLKLGNYISNNGKIKGHTETIYKIK